MRSGPVTNVALLLAASGLLVGCAQTGTGIPRRASMGTLRTSLSHFEYENDQLRKEVAQLKTENRQIEDQLVQEETDNGDLRARLDNARQLLSQRGYDLGSDGADPSQADRESDNPSTFPAGDSPRSRRKAPFTQIPGRIQVAPPPDAADEDPSTGPASHSSGRYGKQSRRAALEMWLPIAQGTSVPTSPGSKVR